MNQRLKRNTHSIENSVPNDNLKFYSCRGSSCTQYPSKRPPNPQINVNFKKRTKGGKKERERREPILASVLNNTAINKIEILYFCLKLSPSPTSSILHHPLPPSKQDGGNKVNTCKYVCWYLSLDI